MFPPWEFIARNGNIKVAISGGYGLLVSPPIPSDYQGVVLAYDRLIVQSLVIVLAGMACWFLFGLQVKASAWRPVDYSNDPNIS